LILKSLRHYRLTIDQKAIFVPNSIGLRPFNFRSANGVDWLKKGNYSLMPAGQFEQTGRIVIGNDPSGVKPWTGEILGLAIYNQALSQEQVSEHF